MNKEQVLEREFLLVRAKILEIAAALDRIDRGEGELPQTDQKRLLRQGIEKLLADSADRAEAIQLLFSREYQPNWREEFQV
ncbi:MAG: hypothetical protein RH917_15425 [Lacipirellulaceae bacterium]